MEGNTFIFYELGEHDILEIFDNKSTTYVEKKINENL